jgi:hypothetical protein
MPAPLPIDPALLQKIVDLVNGLSANCLQLRKYLHKKQGDPVLVPPVILNDQPTSLQWAVDLADSLAQNNANVRTAIHQHDSISEQDIWPDPHFRPDLYEEDLLKTIIMWLQMDLMLFEAMLTFYPNQLTLPHQDCPTIHDAFNELALNAVSFIDVENSIEYKSTPITCVTPLSAPIDGSADPNGVINSLEN